MVGFNAVAVPADSTENSSRVAVCMGNAGMAFIVSRSFFSSLSDSPLAEDGFSFGDVAEPETVIPCSCLSISISSRMDWLQMPFDFLSISTKL